MPPGGVAVTLTATAGSGFVFERWIGDTNTTTNPLVVPMNKPYSLTATFNATLTLRGEPADPTVRAAGFAIAERNSLADIRLFHTFADLFRASFTGDGAAFPPLLDEIGRQ